MREGIAASLDRLRDLGPGRFTRDDGEAVMRVLEASVGSEAIRAAMREPVINLTDALFRTGAEEVGKAAGVAIAFARPDLDALDVLKTGNLYWIGNSWNIKTQNNIAKILEDYFTEGMTREGLTQRFAEDFAGMTDRSRTYWELLADHTATKTREIGRVSGYERAGIERVQVRAHLDEGTTEICRQMDGRIIEVTKMRAQARSVVAHIGKDDLRLALGCRHHNLRASGHRTEEHSKAHHIGKSNLARLEDNAETPLILKKLGLISIQPIFRVKNASERLG